MHEVLLAFEPLELALRLPSFGWYPAARVDTPARPDDAELLERVAGGDKAALASLYDRYSSLLLGLGTRMLRSRGEAEDLLHDVFLEVWRRAGDFDAARGTVRAWLVVRMRSRALDRLKSPRLARAVAYDEEKAEQRAAPVDEPGAGIERARVKAALGALPDEQRACLELAYFDGLSMAEIGQQLGCPAGTVKSRLSAAREKLRTILQPIGGVA